MSNVQVTEINGMKIYNLTGGKSLYELMKESNFSVKKLKRNEEYINHIEILQDCNFPSSSECIRISKDGEFLVASGLYPPRMKIFDLNQMSLKCERGLDSEIRKLEILSDDYKKIATLCEDRNIELHAQYGRHFKIRIPKYGRDIKYDPIYCDLFAAGTGNEIYRLNLYKGQFLQGFETNSEGINELGYNQSLEILGCACEKGVCEIFDLRAKKNCFSFMGEDLQNNFNDLTSISFSEEGLNMALGDIDGVVKVFDLRNPKPLYTIKHSYHFPIRKIKFDSNSKNIITVDSKLAKFSNYKTGKTFINIEPKYNINDFEIFPKSGMFFFSGESEKIEIYFVPQIGPSPKWASFLDNITEELEQAKTYSLYEDYKFVTKNELDEIGGKSLIGTKMLKPYMHGYFIDWRLYKKLKQLTEPFDYDKYLEDKKQQKLKKYFGERIVMNKIIKAKVNSKYLEAIKLNNNNSKENNTNFNVNDERFKKLFSDKDFEIDFNSEKFKYKNKNLIKNEINKEEKIQIENDLKQIEVKDTNKNKEKLDQDNIVNKEIIKLNEKLLKNKKNKLSKFHENNFKEINNENFEERINSKNILINENDEDNLYLNNKDIENKIERLKNKEKIYKEKKQKNLENKNLLKNKRILASQDKLSKLKYK